MKGHTAQAASLKQIKLTWVIPEVYLSDMAKDAKAICFFLDFF